ncbi:hypothetical protein QAD02_015306 [Eretmocerus hayati]|uniref:Uncharacterized protein n=1 Tax=Eretmocerus hayati TaxID=131215 RepID=A0ACC2PAC4_9HYME|nr:hypothetical protein QAD02_015306 [Eretmocerus hayati]
MKPGGSTKVVPARSTAQEVKTRKSLHPLQPAATDKENLVGAGRQLRSTGPNKSLVKNEMSSTMKIDAKKTPNKIVLTRSDPKKAADKKIDLVKAPKNDLKLSKLTPKDNTKGVKVVPKESKKSGRIFKDTAVQTDSQNEKLKKVEISSEDLTSEAGPSENYWEVLAERRGVALQDALEENQRLSERIKVYKEMLEESRALVDVLKDMIGEDRNEIDNSLDDSRL